MKKIHIEELGIDYGLRIWSDLTHKQIKSIEGVVSIWEDTQAGKVLVYVDKRYSLKEIRESLEKMVNG